MWFERAAAGELSAAIEGMEALIGAHPSSATARVRLGELLLRTEPPSADRARRWFDRGLALHEEGCALAPRAHWTALEGAALSRMMSDDYAGALPLLRRSVARWPGATGTRYNLACALCQTGAIDACADELARVLDPAVATPPPMLRDQHRPRAHYVALAQRDPDLAPLRADADRFAQLIAD